MEKFDKEALDKLAKEYADKLPIFKTEAELISLSEALRKHMI